MRKMRKGFTLLELLVVIGVMGILGTLAMVSGQEATNAARATNIADGLEKAAAAMMMYYSDNADAINEKGTTAAAVRTGANAYLKTQLATRETPGQYWVVLTEDDVATATWYVAYKFLATDGNLQAIMANKATRMSLKKTANVPVADNPDTDDVDESLTNVYDGTTDIVYMLVR